MLKKYPIIQQVPNNTLYFYRLNTDNNSKPPQNVHPVPIVFRQSGQRTCTIAHRLDQPENFSVSREKSLREHLRSHENLKVDQILRDFLRNYQ